MKIRFGLIAFLLGFAVYFPLYAQDSKSSGQSNEKSADKATPTDAEAKAYSGMYTFLKDGEFVQVTVEDGGSVTGFISRFGDGESDRGSFLDQFFKTGKLDGSKLNFTTEVIHGVAFEFQGTVERGEGKNPGDEAYYVLRGTLSENTTDANKRVSSRSRPVALKRFPQDAAPAPVVRK